MPAPQIVSNSQVNLGLNLRGLTGGVNLVAGQAQDCLDVLPREDGAIYKAPGWLRRNLTALAGDIVGVHLFNYKGKNSGAGNVREGNYGLADDGAQYTRRNALYTGAVVLTTTTFYFWRPDTQVFEIEALPGGTVIDLAPKPSFITVNDNVYIFGYADHNLRYDPTDRAIYRLGWDNVPAAPGAPAPLAGGTLIAGATYNYAVAWFDIYTGEMSNLGALVAYVPAAPNLSARFAAGDFVNYAGNRKFVGAGANRDVGVVLFRSEPDTTVYHFLAVLNPDLTAAAIDDTGLATAKSQKPLRSVAADEPRFNATDLFNDMIFALSWDSGLSRVYYNTWHGSNSYHERFAPNGYSSVPTRQGEALTAVSHTENYLFVGSQQRGFLGTVSMSSAGRARPHWFPLAWTVGPVGPKAICTAGPWIYFLSERGPYRWREGLAEPQWIGRDLLPLFIDPTSGLCKLNAESKDQSECAYDLNANVVRFAFPIGAASHPNCHLCYWVHDDVPGLDPAAGWFFASPRAQAFAYGNAIAPLGPTGFPVTPFDRASRMVFGDDLGYVNEYEIGHLRGGLAAGTAARGTALAASTVNLLVTAAVLPVAGDGLAGMRLEIVHVDGTIDVRQIAANTINTITPDLAFSQEPDDGAWYVAGVPSFWRGVPEHFGDPYVDKSIVDYAVKTQAMRPFAGIASSDVSLIVGDYSTVYQKTEQVDLALYHDKTMGSATGRFAQIEIANSRPDEMFVLTSYAFWVKPSAVKERDA